MAIEIIPIKTRILTHKDDIVEAIREYCQTKTTKDDVIAVAESVVAITQGRAVAPENIHPCLLAKILCRFFPQVGSISTRYGMQALIDEEGAMRVFCAFIVGSLAKLIGVKGMFYNLAGEQARLIDDFTGTMPPYDKCVVYGPKNPVELSEKITNALGCYGAVVADVNDLKKAAILGTSKNVSDAIASKILIDNPFGNGSQKTPIVIIKNYPTIIETI